MSTIVYQDLQSYSESHVIKTATLKLKIPTPTTAVENITNEKCWSSLRDLSTINYSKEKDNSYVHPLSSSSKLSEKSLALCTENLGSETGTDQTIDITIFSFSSREFKTEQSKVMTNKSTESCRNIPPLLTTLRGSNSLQIQPSREEGRLVIKAIDAPKMRTYFHAERSNGRLRLCFLNDETSVSKFDLTETMDEEDREMEVEREINDEEEGEDEEEEEQEENGMNVKRDMDGNSYEVEAEIGIVNCQRVRRCKEGRQRNKTFCDWRNPLRVATS